MAWDTFTSFTQDTAVDNTWTTLGDISGVTPAESVVVVIGADNEDATTVTDSLEIRVLAAIDDTPTNYTDQPIYSRVFLPSAVTQEWVGFVLAGFEDYRVQTRSSGATDTYTVDGKWKGNGISA